MNKSLVKVVAGVARSFHREVEQNTNEKECPVKLEHLPGQVQQRFLVLGSSMLSQISRQRFEPSVRNAARTVSSVSCHVEFSILVETDESVEIPIHRTSP